MAREKDERLARGKEWMPKREYERDGWPREGGVAKSVARPLCMAALRLRIQAYL